MWAGRRFRWPACKGRRRGSDSGVQGAAAQPKQRQPGTGQGGRSFQGRLPAEVAFPFAAAGGIQTQGAIVVGIGLKGAPERGVGLVHAVLDGLGTGQMGEHGGGGPNWPKKVTSTSSARAGSLAASNTRPCTRLRGLRACRLSADGPRRAQAPWRPRPAARPAESRKGRRDCPSPAPAPWAEAPAAIGLPGSGPRGRTRQKPERLALRRRGRFPWQRHWSRLQLLKEQRPAWLPAAEAREQKTAWNRRKQVRGLFCGTDRADSSLFIIKAATGLRCAGTPLQGSARLTRARGAEIPRPGRDSPFRSGAG